MVKIYQILTMNKIFTLILLLISFEGISQVRISQVYGGSGLSGTFSSTYTQDFVELYNAGTSSVDMGGWSVQFAPATTGTWNVAAVPSGTSIAAGKYFLISLGPTITAFGITLPTPDFIGPTSLNLSGTSGKVALVDKAIALSGTTACNAVSVIDVFGYGSGTTCFETAVFSSSANASQSYKRNINGCTDNNNNNVDFTLTDVTPKNSSSASFVCGTSVLTASQNIANLSSTLGSPSPALSYFLAAGSLVPTSGNINISPSNGLEISFNNSTFFSTPQNVSYTGASLNNTRIYVRIAASTPQGLVLGTITNSGGSAADVVVAVTGGVKINFYSRSVGALSNLSSWGTAVDGTGLNPANFINDYQIFNVRNRANATPGAHWEVSGIGSRLMIGNGTTATTLRTSIADTIKASTIVDVSALSTFEMGSRVAPVFGSLATNSTVNYNFNGTATTDTVIIDNTIYYNLKLTGGLKYFSEGSLLINGDFTYDGTVNSNGKNNPTLLSTVFLRGNLFMVNNANMEDSATGYANRYQLILNGSTATQTINTGTSELKIYRLMRDTTSINNCIINLSANSKLAISNADLRLFQKISGTPTTTTLFLDNNSQLSIIQSGGVFIDSINRTGSINANNANIIIHKSILGNFSPGKLKFTSGSTLKTLTVNITTPVKDTIEIANAVTITGTLNLTKGVVLLNNLGSITLDDAATIVGGSADSYVDGIVTRNYDLNAPATKFFPLGQSKQYSPLEITSSGTNVFSAKYVKQAFGNSGINPATSAAMPGYAVSTREHWLIDKAIAGGTADIKFYYNPSSGIAVSSDARIAHFNGTDWEDVGRDNNGSDAKGNYISKNGISNFSPFTFGGTLGVLPISLVSFYGTLNNNTNELHWKTNCESLGDYFTLQYSKDGLHFTDLYSTHLLGNCNGNSYHYVHSNVASAIHYYRLAIKSVSGNVKLSNVVVLKREHEYFDAKVIATNKPSQLMYNISSPKKGIGILLIVNMQGQQLIKKEIIYTVGNQITYINCASLSSGIYVATFINQNGEVLSNCRFVK